MEKKKIILIIWFACMDDSVLPVNRDDYFGPSGYCVKKKELREWHILKYLQVYIFHNKDLKNL